MRFFIICLVFSSFGLSQTALDLSKIANRREVIRERSKMDCKGLYQQTRLKLELQQQFFNKITSTGGISPEVLVTLSNETAALGQKRREYCEYYRATPEWNKDEYFRAYGELDKRESDIDLIFRGIQQLGSGKQSSSSSEANPLKGLQTISPHQGLTTEDILAAVAELQSSRSQQDSLKRLMPRSEIQPESQNARDDRSSPALNDEGGNQSTSGTTPTSGQYDTSTTHIKPKHKGSSSSSTMSKPH